MWYVKKFFKFIGILLMIIVIAAVLAFAGAFGYHRYMIPKNKEFLTEKGYYTPVSAESGHFNVLTRGSESAKHRIVVLSGAGPAIFFEMKEMSEILEKDYRMIFLSRAGYDESDDSDEAMTVERIVEEYRDTLESANVPKPYILMPHSLGGLYATYWVSKYPEEIEGMIDIDGVCPKAVPEAKANEGKSLNYYLANLGVGDVRPVLHYFMPADSSLSEEEQRASDIMLVSTYSAKAYEEESNFGDVNKNTAWEALKSTDVPKIYIAAQFGFRTTDEYKEYMQEVHPDTEMSEIECQKAFDEIKTERSETVLPCIEKLGNCEIVYLPGDHWIFKQKPQETAAIVQSFIKGLDEKEAQALEEQRQKEEEEKKQAEQAAKKKKKSKSKKKK